jgi:glycosidase
MRTRPSRTALALATVTALAWLSGGPAAAGITVAPPRARAPATWSDQVVYVLIPGKFVDGDPSNDYMKNEYHLPNPNYEGGYLGGDIAGIEQRMRYLKSLGASSVLLYPMLANDTKPLLKYLAGGYRVRNYQLVDPNLGTNAQFSTLLEDFHSTANGPRMNAVLDLPIAMTGLEHPWSAHASVYPWAYRPWNPVVSENVSTEPMDMPYGQVDNNYGMPIVNHMDGLDIDSGVYEHLRDKVVFWLVDHFAIDGFRYDSAQNAYAQFWNQLMTDFRARYGSTKPGFFQVAEDFVLSPKKSWQIWPDEFVDAHVSNGIGPIQMDGTYDFGLIDAIQHVFAKGGDVQAIVDDVNFGGIAFEHPERMIASVDNYENPTFLSQVTGGEAKRKLYLAEAFLLTINRVPFIYSGNEMAIDYSLPGQLFAQGDPVFLGRFRQLTGIRAGSPSLRAGSLRWLDASTHVLSFDRSTGGQHVVVVLNDQSATQPFTVHLGAYGIPCSSAANLLRPGDPTLRLNDPGTAGASLTMQLAPFEPKIVSCTT